jgi:adenylate cyclase
MNSGEQASIAVATADSSAHHSLRLRRPLFLKYFLALFVAVTVPMLIYGASEAWLGYRDLRALLDRRLQVEARAASGRIQDFLDGIREQLGWAVQLPWTDANVESHRFDALRLLRQVPAIVEVTLIDGKGAERLKVSRVSRDIIGSAIDRSDDPAFRGARKARIWFGPVWLNLGSEPYMIMAVAGNRRANGVAVAQINLKLVWDVITAIRVGKSGNAFVSDRSGKLVAHPDLSLVLRGSDPKMVEWLTTLRTTAANEPDEVITTVDNNKRSVVVAASHVAGPDWSVFAAQPLSEAFKPIRDSLWRTAGFVLGGTVFAALLAWFVARRMTEPIRKVEQGVANIGAGQFDYRIELTTGDELERLANRVNTMATELAVSRERADRINRLRGFLSPQVAELVEDAGHADLLAARRAEVVVVFCDMRGFTAFAAKAGATEIMNVLDEYYKALGHVIERYDATLTHFSGDGMMVVLNAPVACPDNPAIRGMRMALDMQHAVQDLIGSWRRQGYALGFGVALAKGFATVGRIGYEGRSDYTAIGNVANLASRLCGTAKDRQVLIDVGTAKELQGQFELQELGMRELRGLDSPVVIYSFTAQRRD